MIGGRKEQLLDKAKKSIFLISYNIVCIVILLFACEVILRLAGLRPPLPEAYNNNFWAKHDKLGYTAIPNSEWSFLNVIGDKDPSIRTAKAIMKIGHADDFGFRPLITNTKCKEAPTVLVVGDSLTFCAEVFDWETWPEFSAQYLLRHNITMKFQNLAMRGYSTVQCYWSLIEGLKRIENVPAVIYMYAGNDQQENFLYAGRPRPYLQISSDKRLAIHPPHQSEEWDNAFRRNRFRGWKIYNLFRKLSLSSLVYKDKGFSGFVEVSDDRYREMFTKNSQLITEWYQRESDTFLRQDQCDLYCQGMRYVLYLMSKECKLKGIDFYVACCPTGFFTRGLAGDQMRPLLQMDEREYAVVIDARDRTVLRIKELCESASIRFLDINMDCLGGLGYREILVSPVDEHNSAQANKIIGEEVAKLLMGEMTGTMK